MKVRTGTENLNNNYTKIAQRKHTWGGGKKGEKTILASIYRAAKAGHISAKGNGGKITGGLQVPGSKSWTHKCKGQWRKIAREKRHNDCTTKHS